MSIKTSDVEFKLRIRQQIEDPIMRRSVSAQIGKKWSMS